MTPAPIPVREDAAKESPPAALPPEFVGRAFGSFVHRLLELADFSKPESVRKIAPALAPAFPLTKEAIARAEAQAEAALSLPIMREAARAARVFREVPISYLEEAGCSKASAIWPSRTRKDGWWWTTRRRRSAKIRCSPRPRTTPPNCGATPAVSPLPPTRTSRDASWSSPRLGGRWRDLHPGDHGPGLLRKGRGEGPRGRAFAWSASRHDTFATCPRKYYYSYYGILEDPEVQRLKQLSALALWAGSVIDETIEDLLRRTITFPSPRCRKR